VSQLPWLRIVELHHPLLQLLRRLDTPAGRYKSDRYVVEGLELVARALEFGAPVEAIVLSEELDPGPLPLSAPLPSLHLARPGLMAHLTSHKPAPTALAVVRRRLHPLRELLTGELLVMLERPASPDNLGMLLRSAEAAGLRGLALLGEGADPFQRRAIRASRGGLFRLQLAHHDDPLQAIVLARQAGYQVVASSARQGEPYTELDLARPTALLLGNEHTGLPPELCDASDCVARIPMSGRLSSLNLAVASSLLLYEALRQRGLPLGG
jgi:TrmH family RNA methyltransferase